MEVGKYLQAVKDYFWQWEEGDNLIAIPNSSTIAYREYIVEILEHLSPQGIPPFGTLLLSIIATNLGSQQSLIDIEAMLVSFSYQNIGLTSEVRKTIERAFSFLRTLNNLPEKYREGDKRMQLFQLIFEATHNSTSQKKSIYIINYLKFRKIPETYFVKEDLSTTIILRDVKALSLLFDRFKNSDDIIEGIASLPEIEAIELETKETQKTDFVEELRQNDKTFHIGALIKSLWSGLNIPLHSNLPSQQPLGGVSDISNKGDFDKLLISEFANDSTVFLSRLANNEALYINREIPPQSNNLERIILIDISIRNWGTPKTLAYAIMLALAKHPKTKIHSVAYAVGKHYYPIAYNSIDSIIDALSNIDSCLTAYDGFKEFFADSIAANREIIVITTRDAVKYPQMKQLLEEKKNSINYIVYTNTEGEIDLYRQTPKTKKHLQSIVLPLDGLWSNKPKKAKETESKDEIDLVANVNDCPLLYLINQYSKGIKESGNDFYCIDYNCLYKKADDNKGWIIIYSQLEKGLTTYQLGWNNKYEVLLLLCYSNRKVLELVNIATGKKISKHYGKLHQLVNSYIYFIGHEFYIEILGTKCAHISLDLEIKIETRFPKYDPSPPQMPGQEQEQKQFPTPVMANTIKNLKEVSLTTDNQILINRKHIFQITENYMKMYPNANPQIKERSYYKENAFTFKNGVTAINENGMLLITLKDKKKIYIPLVVDYSLAIAYDGKVFGNPYFYKDDAEMGNIDEIISILKSDETWN